MKINDLPFYKVYREHTTLVPVGFKAVQQGFSVTDQDDYGEYAQEKGGDECGWIYWEANTRPLGAWAQVFAVVAGTAGTIRPILSHGLGADITFATKTVIITSASGDNTKVRAIDGAVPAEGTYGSVIQCVNQDSYELLFFPASSTQIKVDNAGVPDTSTVIFDVLADESINPTNAGKTSDFLVNHNNISKIKTTAKFHETTSRTGALGFTEENFPVLVPPDEAPFVVETKLAWHAASSKWRWYTQIGGGTSTTLARVRFNHDGENDLSEGEIVTYDPGTKLYTSSGTAIWIDTNLSQSVLIETLGDSAVFEITKIRGSVNRNEIIRNLYFISKCRDDRGYEVSHLRVTNKFSSTARLLGNALSRDLVAEPWLDPLNAKIYTTILNVQLENILLARHPSEWDTNGPEDFQYMEVSDLSRGWPLFFRPIRPVLSDENEAPVYESAIKIGEGSIAKYRRYV